MDTGHEIIPESSMPWYGRALPQLAAMACLAVLSAVTLLSWPIRSVRRCLGAPTGSGDGEAWRRGLGTSVVAGSTLFLIVGVLTTLSRFLMSDETALLRYSSNLGIRALSWVAPLGALALSVVPARRRSPEEAVGQIDLRAIAMAVAGLLLLLILRYWELARL